MNSKQNALLAPAVLPTLPVAPRPPKVAAVDTTALVADPQLVAYLRATLRRHGVASQDLADGIASAQLAAVEVARDGRMPADIAQWKALTARIAVRWAIDRRREAEARESTENRVHEDPDAYSAPTLDWEARDPVDTKRYLAILKDLFDSGQMPRDAAEILLGEADGVPHAQIAKELGISVTAVNKQLARARAKFRARLAALGMLALALVIFAAQPSTDVVTAPAPEPPPAPALSGGCASVWDGGPCPHEIRRRPWDKIGRCPINLVRGAKRFGPSDTLSRPRGSVSKQSVVGTRRSRWVDGQSRSFGRRSRFFDEKWRRDHG